MRDVQNGTAVEDKSGNRSSLCYRGLNDITVRECEGTLTLQSHVYKKEGSNMMHVMVSEGTHLDLLWVF